MSSTFKQGVEVPPGVSLAAGAFSGVVARFLVAPIDVVKIRMQLQTDIKYRGIMSTVRSILRNEGIAAFWKGNIPAEFMYLVYGSSQFTFYTGLNAWAARLEKRNHLHVPSPIHSLIVGSAAGCLSTFVSYPLDVLRTRLISNDHRHFSSLFNECRRILSANGIAGFFGGGTLSILTAASGAGLSFATYNIFRDHNPNYPLLSGFAAGALSKTCVYPLDLLKRRRQLSTAVSSWRMASHIMATEGIRGFYHGLIPSVLKSAPTTMLSLYFYEMAAMYLMKGL